jgi:putative ATP-grasp target RiPP
MNGPQPIKERDPVNGTLRPWGATRLTGYAGSVGVAYARLELDPVTQVTRYLDKSGNVLEMGKHGTNAAQGTSNPTGGGDGGGPNPPEPDDVNVTDYVPD